MNEQADEILKMKEKFENFETLIAEKHKIITETEWNLLQEKNKRLHDQSIFDKEFQRRVKADENLKKLQECNENFTKKTKEQKLEIDELNEKLEKNNIQIKKLFEKKKKLMKEIENYKQKELKVEVKVNMYEEDLKKFKLENKQFIKKMKNLSPTKKKKIKY